MKPREVEMVRAALAEATAKGIPLRLPPAVYRDIVRETWRRGEIDAWEAVRRLFNAGLRGRDLVLR